MLQEPESWMKHFQILAGSERQNLKSKLTDQIYTKNWLEITVNSERKGVIWFYICFPAKVDDDVISASSATFPRMQRTKMEDKDDKTVSQMNQITHK